MDRARVAGEHRHQPFELGGLDPAELLHPLLALAARALVDPPGRRVRDGGEDGARIAGEPERDIAVLADGGIVLVDLDQRRRLGDAPAIAHAEVEGRADDQDRVGLLEGVRPRAVEMVRIAFGQHAAARPVHIGRDVERADEGDGRLVAAARPDLLAEQDGGPLGGNQDVGQALDIGRVADRLGRHAVAAGFRDARALERDLGVEDVARDLEIGRAVGAVEALARGHRHHVGHPLGREHAGSELGDRRHHVDMRQVLERAHPVLGERALAADMEDRALRPEGGGDAGDRVGAAGPGGGHHAAELPGLAGIAVGGMRRGLLVAHVDDADAGIEAAVVDVDDMPAAEGEDRVHPLVAERAGDQMAAGDDALVAALLRQRVMRRRRRLLDHGAHLTLLSCLQIRPIARSHGRAAPSCARARARPRARGRGARSRPRWRGGRRPSARRGRPRAWRGS